MVDVDFVENNEKNASNIYYVFYCAICTIKHAENVAFYKMRSLIFTNLSMTETVRSVVRGND